MLIALEARKDEPAAGVFIWTGIVYYELGDMENAYKYFDLTYNEHTLHTFLYGRQKILAILLSNVKKN